MMQVPVHHCFILLDMIVRGKRHQCLFHDNAVVSTYVQPSYANPLTMVFGILAVLLRVAGAEQYP